MSPQAHARVNVKHFEIVGLTFFKYRRRVQETVFICILIQKFFFFFLRFMTMREKQILARAVGIQKKKKLGVTTHFSEIIKKQ